MTDHNSRYRSIPAGYHPEMHQMVELPLDNESVVFIIGNHEGITAAVFQEAFQPKIFGFDPQPRMCSIARQRVPESQVFEFGLGDKNGVFPLYNMGTDACSFTPGEAERGTRGEGRMVDIAEFLVEHNVTHIDLFHMNCQGYEWILLPYMYEKGMFDKIDYFLLQFHMAPEESAAAEKVYAQLAERFDIIWDIGPETWQLLRRKGLPGDAIADRIQVDEKTEPIAVSESEQKAEEPEPDTPPEAPEPSSDENLTAEAPSGEEAATAEEAPAEEEPKKRGPGRPKGSKNKPKTED